MNWKKWKRGLFIASLTGVLTGVCGLIIGVTLQQALLLLVGTAAKDVLLYLKNHPIEGIQDTDLLYRDPVTKPKAP